MPQVGQRWSFADFFFAGMERGLGKETVYRARRPSRAGYDLWNGEGPSHCIS